MLTLLNVYIHSKDGTGKVDYEFTIALVDSGKPFYFTPRRLSWHERNEVKEIIRDLLERGIIRPSNSNFCSPIVLIKRKGKRPRLCVDFRVLNKITIKDKFPLLLIEDQIARLASSSY